MQSCPDSPRPKSSGVREHEPAVYARIAQVLLPKDYIRYRLTGVYATEVSDASGTALFDVAQRRWSDEMLKALDLPPHGCRAASSRRRFPRASARPRRVPPGSRRDTGCRRWRRRPGCSGRRQRHRRAGDPLRDLRHVRRGLCLRRDLCFRSAGRLHAFCHAVPGKWHLMGVMLSAGGSFAGSAIISASRNARPPVDRR